MPALQRKNGNAWYSTSKRTYALIGISMKNKNKVTKLNEEEYNSYIESMLNGENVEVPNISEVKKD